MLQPLLDLPTQPDPYAKGSWGPGGGRRARQPATAAGTDRGWGHEHAHRVCARRRLAADGRDRDPERRRAVAVLADRRVRVPVGLPHRGAGGARRGDRLAVRAALRLAERVRHAARPRGGHVPARAVRHQPPRHSRLRARHQHARHDLEDARPSWVEVRDALIIGPRRGEDTITPHTRPPADDDAEHLLVRTAECLEGMAEIELVCEPVFDYGRTPADWALVGDDLHAADASGNGQVIRLQTDMSLGIEGNRVRARHVLQAGEKLFCSLSWAEGLAGADGRRRRVRTPRGDPALLAELAGPCAAPGPSLARPDPAFGAGDQGPDVHADRSDGGGADDVAARDAGRRAQLGLPLHLDARLDVHAAGAALAQPRLGSRRVHAVRRRRRAQRGRRAADHVRDRRAPRPDRVDARRPLGLRRREAGADRQRGVRPAPERRLRRRAGLDPAAHAPQPAAAAAAVADRAGAGRVRDARVARARPGHLGGPRRRRSTTCRRS